VTPASITRRLLFVLATSDRFAAAVRGIPPLWRAAYKQARRYVAGERLEDAIALASRLDREGIAASLDFFGEQVADPEAAQEAADAFVSLASALDDLPDSTYLAIDLSHIGLDVGSDFCRRQLERIAGALPSGRRIDIGAEDSGRTEAAQRVALDAAHAGAPLQMTLQANLRRSSGDWPRLVEAGIAIRLVKGAYVERPEVAFPFGTETELAYLQLANALHESGAQLALATHDAVIREALLMAFGPTPIEMLLGVRSEDADDLVRRRIPVRLYVPYGNGWFRYWMRRIAEARGA
jgi:proline dehydrogenase